jgi:hypothetical protein
MRPDELLQRLACLAQRDSGAGVRNRRLDLAPVADNPRVTEEPLDVGLTEGRDSIDLEACERRPESLALAQDRQSGEPGLEALEAEPLVDAALVAHRPAPLLVVVGEVQGIRRRPAADQVSRQSRP